MREIQGKARTVRELLSGRRYAIDYYQRDYRWATKQVSELINDLSDRFLRDHDPAHPRTQVEQYGHYFLGPVIMSRKDAVDFIVDGQQRLTTLTLLLIHLNQLQSEREEKVKIDEMIFSEKYGKKSFNLDVDERAVAMDALYNGEDLDVTGEPESVFNMVARYEDIQSLLPEELSGGSLPYFIDWLRENVHFVEITAFSDEDAYTIFETMNDRGLSLTPTDMLKGYLLASILDTGKRTHATKVWKKRLEKLNEIGKEEDSDFLKAWLRSQYADSIRERKAGAEPKDFDRLGTEFHRWIREQHDHIGLSSSEDFYAFIDKDLTFYARQYEQLRRASTKLTSGLETVFYAAQLEFTLQYPVLLAPLRTDDDEETIQRKLGVVGDYIDILIARRIWNSRSIAYSTMQYAMFLVMKEIRGATVDELVKLLTDRLATEENKFATTERLKVHQQNRRFIHWLLARLIDYVERESGLPRRYTEYVGGKGLKKYEVEHIWADKFSRHRDEFSHEADFQEYRNRLGDLLLLPKAFNASYGALPYAKKHKHYDSQNILARSLHPNSYEHNPGFLRFVKKSGLPFKSHADFRKADVDARQELYKKLAELVWSPDRLERTASE